MSANALITDRIVPSRGSDSACRADALPARKSGFPVFAAPAGKTITLEDVKRAEDEA